MKFARKVLAGCAAAVLVLLAGACCTAGLAGAAPERKVLDPSNPNVDLSAEDVKIIWSHDLEQIAEGKGIREVHVIGGVVVVETPDSTLYYFEAAHGVRTGTTSLKTILSQPPALGEKYMYAVSGKWLRSIDPNTGEIKDSWPLPPPLSCKPLPLADALILGTGTANVLRFSTDTGVRVWKALAEGPVTHTPVIYEGYVYAVGSWGSVAAFESTKGTEIWRWRPRAPSKLTSGLAVEGDMVYVGDNRGYVYCLMAEAPTRVWEYPVGNPIVQSPRVVGGKLLVFSYEGGAHCLTLGGQLLWKYEDAERLVATGRYGLYMLTRDHGVACVSPETGEKLWRLPLAEGCVVASDPSQSVFYVYRPGGAMMAVTEMD